MPTMLTDQQIQALIDEEKPLDRDWRTRLRPTKAKSNRQHAERQMDVRPPGGHSFRIVVRENRQNRLDFSVILVFEDDGGVEHPLVRYNGRHSSRHTNRLEKMEGLDDHTFGPCFHIHRATERYQQADLKIDGFAQETDAYDTLDTALQAFVRDCGFQEPPTLQQKML